MENSSKPKKVLNLEKTTVKRVEIKTGVRTGRMTTNTSIPSCTITQTCWCK